MKLILMFVFEKEFLGSSPFEYIVTNTLYISIAMFRFVMLNIRVGEMRHEKFYHFKGYFL